MTTRVLFDSPYLLGFEHTRDLIERAARTSSEGYPPYNVEATAGGVRISIAVAGFRADQLAVTVEDRQLTVAGRRDADGEDRAFLHRGIAARNFSRTFVLADGMEVSAAALEHGLLHIDVIRPEPEKKTKSIPIRANG
jgi:HSP20 family molecular chaperone IbpA